MTKIECYIDSIQDFQFTNLEFIVYGSVDIIMHRNPGSHTWEFGLAVRDISKVGSEPSSIDWCSGIRFELVDYRHCFRSKVQG